MLFCNNALKACDELSMYGNTKKLVKFEYSSLKVNLWQTDDLKPFSDLDI